jgi:hypothetical protein
MPGSMNTMRCGLISEAALLSGSEKIVPRALLVVDNLNRTWA